MLIKKGSKGEDVKKIQALLDCIPDGVFGPETERLVKQWQEKHGLVADGIVGDKTWSEMFAQNENGIIYDPVWTKVTTAKNRTIKYIVIHYTAGSSSTAGKAKAARNVFLSRDASADFCVDDMTVVQVNPDPKNYYCWAVGDGKGKRGIYNKDCMSIEICSNLKKGTSAAMPNHEGWFFTDAALNRAVELTKKLMKEYNIPVDRVIRHYDASGKACPGIVGWNDEVLYDPITGKSTGKRNNSDKWKEFKKKLTI